MGYYIDNKDGYRIIFKSNAVNTEVLADALTRNELIRLLISGLEYLE